MPSSYPGSVKTFTTKITGQIIEASHINELQDEVSAVETGLLHGLAHNLSPDTNAQYDLGASTRRWRELLSQKATLGLTAATRFRIQEVGTSTWLTVNANYDGTGWKREDTSQPAQAIEITNTKEVKYYYTNAGTDLITWSPIFTVSTNRITAGQAVFGTDPGGAETLRAENLRAGSLTTPSAIVGEAPSGTEKLRTENLRAGVTTLTGTLTAPTGVFGTDTGGTEKLRAENLRAGTTTLTSTLSAPTALIGTAPSGSEVLRTQNLRTDTLAVNSTTLVTNLNADMVDGRHASELGFGAMHVETTAGTHTWVVPSGVTRIRAIVIGGGGGGAGARGGTANLGGGGGGAGGYAEAFITVTPGDTLTLTVGSGGLGGSAPTSQNSISVGQNGGMSSIQRDMVSLLQATGGIGGSTGGGTGGMGSLGSLHITGGDGVEGGSSELSGYGGSSPYGAGGGHRTAPGSGQSGRRPGGGGSGALGGTTIGYIGGNGASGAIIIYY